MALPVILTVDDDRAVLAAIRDDLDQRYARDYRVVEASSGKEALSVLGELQLRANAVALMLVDQRMPIMTGVEFLAEARRLYPDAKRVLLTAYADTDAAIRAINDADVDHYLRKPWDPPDERLYPVLDDLLRTWAPPRPEPALRLFGTRWSSQTHDLREFLTRNLVPYAWVDIDLDEDARRALELTGHDSSKLPVAVFDDGTMLTLPTRADLAERIGGGLRTHATNAAYDLVVVGAGPAGLAASVYGASEGLSTLLIEGAAPGGQAGTTSRIENYLGFPRGLSGADLTDRARQQATRFGVEILTPQEVVGLERSDPYLVVGLADGTNVTAGAIVVATGVNYRTLAVPGADELAGAGIYYSAGRAEATDHAGGAVFVVGGGNSAGQGAMFLSGYARQVTLLVRDVSLAATMSRYLIDQLDAADNVTIQFQRQVVGVTGDGRLESLTLADVTRGDDHRDHESTEEVAADALFVFIGMQPRTDWLGDHVDRDGAGFILTGVDLGPTPRAWPLEQPPLPLESNVPGLFVAGDVRHQSVKRVASAVGEGAVAVRFVHERLAAR